MSTPTLHVSQHPAIQHKLGILRDERTEPKKFREIVRELSWLLGYEALADARVRPLEIRTPLETMQSAELVFGIWRDEFLGMYEWGGLFDLTMHPQLTGQPSRLLWLRRLIHVIREHPDVWWATGHEVAEHWMASRTAGR